MAWLPIDLEQYERREHFLHYLNQVPCYYSMTVQVEVTQLVPWLKSHHIKFYPTLIYALSRIVNEHREFRMSLDEDGNLGYYETVDPTYTIFHQDDETFSSTWTTYTEDFSLFYEYYLQDQKEYGKCKGLIAKPDMPDAVFNISMIPWVSFNGFNLNLPRAEKFLLPIFTIGKYYEQDGKVWLPLAIQVHHAVCDGFHVSRFVCELQELISQFDQIIKSQ